MAHVVKTVIITAVIFLKPIKYSLKFILFPQNFGGVNYDFYTSDINNRCFWLFNVYL